MYYKAIYCRYFLILSLTDYCTGYLMGCLHDPANVQQTSSKWIQKTRANDGRLLEVCWTSAGSCKHHTY